MVFLPHLSVVVRDLVLVETFLDGHFVPAKVGHLCLLNKKGEEPEVSGAI